VSGQLHAAGALPLKVKSHRHVLYRLGGPQCRSGRFGEQKIIHPTGTRTPNSQSLYRLKYHGSFAKLKFLKKISVSFGMLSVHPSVPISQLTNGWKDFHEIWRFSLTELHLHMPILWSEDTLPERLRAFLREPRLQLLFPTTVYTATRNEERTKRMASSGVFGIFKKVKKLQQKKYKASCQNYLWQLTWGCNWP
jgi:hypothetical protein